MTQLKALQDPASLKEKMRRNIDQIKYAKQASAIQQPCDTGNLHVHERHHSKTVSLSDLPEMNLLNVIAEQLQHFRDIGELNICAKTMEHIVNMGIRMPTILQKSCDSKSLQKAFFIPGIFDTSQQGSCCVLTFGTDSCPIISYRQLQKCEASASPLSWHDV